MGQGFGQVNGPEYNRLTEKLFGTRFVTRPISGVADRMTVAEHVRLAAEQKLPVTAEATLVGWQAYRMDFAVYRATNRLLAMGRTPKELCISLVGSSETTEAEFRQVLKRAADVAQKLNLLVADVELRRADVSAMIMTATVSGVPVKVNKVGKGNAKDRATEQTEEVESAEKINLIAEDEPEASYHIVMAGYAGVEGTLELYRERGEELAARLPGHFCKASEELWQCLDVSKAVQIGREHGAAAMMTYGDGGIFRGLWDLGEWLRLGMELELPEILLRQQTIEACEYMDINPYQMRGGGCVLMVTDRTEELLEALWQQDIPAADIGVLTKNPAKVLRNGEEERYLEPFRGDSLS